MLRLNPLTTPFLAYRHHVANRDFVKALAILPESQWVATSKRRWMCARLGIFSPLLDAGWQGFNVRSGVAYAEALSAYGHIKECQAVLYRLHQLIGIKRYQPELIREFAKYNLPLSIKAIEQMPVHNKTVYHQALYLDYLYRQASTVKTNHIERQKPFDELKVKVDSDRQINISQQLQILGEHLDSHPDLTLLKSNWQAKTPLDKLARLNEYNIHFNLPPLKLLSATHDFNSLNIEPKLATWHHPLSITSSNSLVDCKVSILVTVYNAEKYIASTLNSLLNQSWHNVEVIMIDDASTDKSLVIAKRIAVSDSRLTVISQLENKGTYAAKDKGLRCATGDFIICHDSDDWANPYKIESQILPLLLNSRLMATTSAWIKVDDSGSFVSRVAYPYQHKNPSSLMFRRKAMALLAESNVDAAAKGDIWQAVRTGADSELFERFKLTYGKNSIFHIDKPLTIGAHRNDSLMNAKYTGTINLDARRKRLMYWEKWRRQHIELVKSGIIG